MKISELKWLLKDKRAKEEIHKHLWIESQKVGYDIGIARATDEWLRLYAERWMRHHTPRKFKKIKGSAKPSNTKKKTNKTRKTKIERVRANIKKLSRR